MTPLTRVPFLDANGRRQVDTLHWEFGNFEEFDETTQDAESGVWGEGSGKREGVCTVCDRCALPAVGIARDLRRFCVTRDPPVVP